MTNNTNPFGQNFGQGFGGFTNQQFGNNGGIGKFLMQMLRLQFKNGTVLTRLIYINIGMYIAINLFGFILRFFGVHPIEYDAAICAWLGIPSNIDFLITRPWTVISSMFVHISFWHVLFNMLWLNVFGKIFLESFTQKHLLSVYVVGGIVGAVFYIGFYDVMFENPSFNLIPAIGASASVMAVVFSTCVFQPNREIILMLLGRVKLIYIAVGIIILDLFGLSGSNAGGSLAHFGGALYGVVFTLVLYGGFDLSFSGLKFKNHGYKPKMKINRKPNTMSDFGDVSNKKDDDVVNQILDKVSQYGYDSLTKEEKAILFKHQ